MRIYLAGGISGNCKAYWDAYMKLYLAGTYSRDYCVKEAMKLYLAGNYPGKMEKGDFSEVARRPQELYILESFYYIRDATWVSKMIPLFKGFMLDSGAFTYMQEKGKGGGVDWNKYIDEYADFIKEHSIELFMELDIDSIVGVSDVIRLRKRLERRVGRPCIPVFHRSRGKAAWGDMLISHPYVAIGGIATREFKRNEHHLFNWFIKTAHDAGRKIHGLGYTNLTGLSIMPFDSVDSTAWLYGNRGGFVYLFNGKTIIKRKCPPGMRLNSRETAIHNFNEWVKYQKYAEAFL